MPFGHIQWLAYRSTRRLGLARTTLARIPLADFVRPAAARFDHPIGPRQRGDRVAVFWPGEPCASRPFLYPSGLLGNSHVS